MIPLFASHWVHDLDPFLVRFTDTIGVRYYGLAYLAGFAIAWWALRFYGRRGLTKLDADQAGDLMTALIIGVLVGGRLGYFAFYQPAEVLRDPLVLLRIMDGGMASHGGFIGVALALWWCARRFRLPFLHISDLVVSVAPVGIFFGRVANFINGELWGRPSNVPWAVIFPESRPGMPVELIEPRHPSQVYAALLEGLALFALMQWLLWKTPWLQRAPGRITGVFLLGYAAMRAVSETFREPDAGLIFGLTRGTFYSIFLVLAGLVLIALCRPNPPTLPQAKS
jgi:phosphatidylglycerol:prolipoprotein diacylglycerol transferase